MSCVALVFILLKTGISGKGSVAYKWIVIIIGTVCCVLFAFYTIFGVSAPSKEVKAEINEIVYTSGFADILPHYTIYLRRDDGSLFRVQTLIISSKKLNEKLSGLKKGDDIIVYFESCLNNLYDVKRV